MKNLTTGDEIISHGEQLMLVVKHSATVTVQIITTAGSWVTVSTVTADEVGLLPGYAGARYRVTFSAGTVDIHGSCTIE